MNLLLDTNVLLWALAASPRLSARIRSSIREADRCYVSVVSAWEIEIKVALGKLRFQGDIEHHLKLNRFLPLEINLAHAIAAGRLPKHHSDPFDRMLIAQAQLESLTLVTSDAALKAYKVPVILA